MYIISLFIRKLFNPVVTKNVTREKNTKICSGSKVYDSCLSRYSYIGNMCFVLKANIGPFCSIADNCRIGSHEHSLDYISTSPVFFAGRNCMSFHFSSLKEVVTKRVNIEADVWIGANVFVKSGVNIGVGAVVGANSVVTKDIPPYEIWAGNPARKIRDRFDEDDKKILIDSKWWLFETNKIQELIKNNNSIRDILIKMKGR